MSAVLRRLPLYLVVIAACYTAAWFISFVIVNGSFDYSAQYFRLFWTGAGGERPMFTGAFSVILAIPLSFVAIWVLRRRLKSKNETSG